MRSYYNIIMFLLPSQYFKIPRANALANMTLHNVIMQAVYINNNKHGQHDIF